MKKKKKITVNRTYKCLNKECEGAFCIEEDYDKDFRKLCPFCKKKELVLDSGSVSFFTGVDFNKPKTLGSISDQNVARREKENPVKEPDKTPFWRKGKKINYNILKNPQKYIETGKI